MTQAWPTTGPYLHGVSGHVTQAGPVSTLPWDLYIVLEEILSMWKSPHQQYKRITEAKEFEMN